MRIEIDKAATGDPLAVMERHAAEGPQVKGTARARDGFAAVLDHQIRPAVQRNEEPGLRTERREVVETSKCERPLKNREKMVERRPAPRQEEIARGDERDEPPERTEARATKSDRVKKEDAIVKEAEPDGRSVETRRRSEEVDPDEEVVAVEGEGEDAADTAVAIAQVEAKVADEEDGPGKRGGLWLVASLGQVLVPLETTPTVSDPVSVAAVAWAVPGVGSESAAGTLTEAALTPTVEVKTTVEQLATPSELAGVLARAPINDNEIAKEMLSAGKAIAAATDAGASIPTGGGSVETMAALPSIGSPAPESRMRAVAAAGGLEVAGKARHAGPKLVAVESGGMETNAQITLGAGEPSAASGAVTASAISWAGTSVASARSAASAYRPVEASVTGKAEEATPVAVGPLGARGTEVGLAASAASGAASGLAPEGGAASAHQFSAKGEPGGTSTPQASAGQVVGNAPPSGNRPDPRAPAAGRVEGPAALEKPTAPAATPNRAELDVTVKDGESVRLVVETIGQEVRVRARATAEEDATALSARVAELRSSLREHGLELRGLDAGAPGSQRRAPGEDGAPEQRASREPDVRYEGSRPDGEAGAGRERSDARDGAESARSAEGQVRATASTTGVAGSASASRGRGRRLSVVA